ncbi:MAG: hypothetical protein AB1599_11130, partial [Planctomycetota bacterium]
MNCYGGDSTYTYGDGAAGTIYTRDTSDIAAIYGTLTINNYNRSLWNGGLYNVASSGTPLFALDNGVAGVDKYQFDEFILQDNARVYLQAYTVGETLYETVLEGGDFIIDSGTVAFDVPQNITTEPLFKTFAMTGSSTLTHSYHESTHNYSVIFSVTQADGAGTVTIASGSSINVNGKGYGSALGTGPGTDAGGDGAAGGGAYGGNGGTSSQSVSGGTAYQNSAVNPYVLLYDVIKAPTYLGSGGGNATEGATGGRGAGAIKITCSGSFTLDGTISANGDTGGTAWYDAAGGGAGGSVWITASGTLSGAGSISANGGNGGAHGDR